MDKLRSNGQMTIEMILIMTVLLGVAMSLSKTARESGWTKNLVQGPWLPMKGMIEDGVWMKSSDASRALHPANKKRHGSVQGDKP